MKRILSVSIPLTFLLVALFFIFINAEQAENKNFKKANEHKSEQKSDDKEKKKSCCAEETGSGEYSDNSIYQVESGWQLQSGKEFKLSELKGKNVVLSMIFANCTYACPIIVNDMKKVESGLTKEEKKNTQFILVSIDHERDTPEAMTVFASRYNLDLNRWKLLSGKKDDIRELAALLGFRYVKDEKGDYSHSNLINVLDREGEIAYQHEGLNKDVSDVVNQIRLLGHKEISLNQ